MDKMDVELTTRDSTSVDHPEDFLEQSNCCKIYHAPLMYSKIPDILPIQNKWINTFVNTRPNLWAIASIAIYQYIVYIFFMCVYLKNDYWYLIYSKTEDGIFYFYMGLTMILGAFIAGSTPEGGGAVAYPVMTILLRLPSNVGRDFSLMIQSFGMTSASLAVLYSKIKIDPDVIICATLGGIAIIPWLKFIAPYIPGTYAKVFFVSYYLTFIVVLFYTNMRHRKILFESTFTDTWRKRIIFFLCGAIGSIITCIAGTGTDTFTYQVMVLGFGLHEKVGNPTCVIIMSLNVIIGWFAQAFIWGNLSPLAYRFFLVGLPVCVLFAPIGAYINSMVNRYAVLALVFLLDVIQYILVIVFNPKWEIGVTSIVTFFGVTMIVACVARFGIWNAERYEAKYTTETEWNELNPIAKFICWRVIPIVMLTLPQILLFCTPLAINIEG